MLSHFDFYEKELNAQIKKYNELVDADNFPSAVFIHQSIICPLLNKYKSALWAGNIINKNGIYSVKYNNEPVVVYISFKRSLESLRKF
jgi:hypothetical protein